MNTNRFQRLVFAVLAVLAGVVPLVAEEVADAPVPVERMTIPTFGPDVTVAALGGLLSDPDLRVRLRAAHDLGQTHNLAALTWLNKAIVDESPLVRAQAVNAACEIGRGEVLPLLRKALEDPDARVRLAGLAICAAQGLTATGPQVAACLQRPEANVRAAALQALTALGQAADIVQLENLLAADAPRLRLGAAENALLLKPGGALPGGLMDLARTEPIPAVRAAAVEAVGVLTAEQAENLVTEAARSEQPLLRRAAVRVYARNRQRQAIEPFLADDAPLVRLAALRAAATQAMPEASAVLFERMLDSPGAEAHLAARDALVRIGSQAVAELAARKLPELMAEVQSFQARREKLSKSQARQNADGGKRRKPKPGASDLEHFSRRLEVSQRNAGACAYLLGELRSKQGYATLLSLLEKLPLDSPTLGAVGVAVGKIGDPRAVPILARRVDQSYKVGYAYLRAMMMMATPPPFSEQTAGELAGGYARLGKGAAVGPILELGRVNVQGQRLTRTCTAIVRLLPTLKTSATAETVQTFLLEVLSDASHGLPARLNAAELAGQWRLKAAEDELRDLLLRERPCRVAMLIAARALGRITGTVPPVGKPVANEGNWILRRFKD